MINRGKELIRICPANAAKLEYSKDNGRSWIQRYYGNTYTGIFSDLLDNGKEILANTSKGLFYSKDDGRNWIIRHR
ncbi:MAG: hypothetical protein LKI59_09490 [Bacteroidales bacterium]|jgi:hypothetical protein|nr:hypothetical protein [Bacteroidales bacterium]